ncbi:MAG: hypothetical protein ACOY30_13165 [Bacillota bacterium]
MTEFLGWTGFVILLSTLVPFVLRRVGKYSAPASFFTRRHHFFALASFMVLTLHGLWALFGRKGWGWGAKENTLSGLAAWLLLLSVIVLAERYAGKRPLQRTHCGVAALMVALAFYHAF